ncbi:unnamed protein product [Sympodiomycopsis kandeliae]
MVASATRSGRSTDNYRPLPDSLRNVDLPNPMGPGKEVALPSPSAGLKGAENHHKGRFSSNPEGDFSFTSPRSDVMNAKVEGMAASESASSSEDISYSDSEEGTEQAHNLPPLQSESFANARVRLGKGGSRAQQSNAPLAPPPRTDSLSSIPQKQAGTPANSGVVPPSSPRAGGAATPARRKTGGLSGALKSPAIESNSMFRGVSYEGSEAGGASTRSLYRPIAGKNSDLSDWAPDAQGVYNDPNIIENLPNWNTMKPGDSTSKPITKIERDMDWSMRRLLSENVFQQLLDDPLGRHRFRAFLQSEGSEGVLDFYFDLSQYQEQSNNLKQTTEALYDLYVAEDSESHMQLPDQYNDELYNSLRRAFDVQVSLNPMQEHVRQKLYKDQFQRFIRAMLIEQNKVKLGVFGDDNDESYTGLGDCFCLTNPRAGTENPIVLVSPGFVEVTGYPTRSILGRNCRFLQGPGTNPDSVQRIRDALNAGRPITELLLNYRRDGTPFFCLLSIIPLRDASGALAYFIGGQTNVTGTLASSKGLGFLVGNSSQESGELQAHIRHGYELSPTMARHISQVEANNSSAGGFGQGDRHRSLVSSPSARSLKAVRKSRGAAGAYDPSTSQGPTEENLLSNTRAGPQNRRSSSNQNSGFMSRFFNKGGRQARIHVGGPQRLLGAEGTMRQAAPGRLADQMNFFSDLYSRLIIFKRHKREVIFATKPLLETLGLPVETPFDVYNNDLLHADIVSLMQGSNKGETKALRAAVQDAVRAGDQISLMTGLRQPKTGLQGLLDKNNGENSIVTYRALHITPLHDRDNSSFAFVAVLG